METTRNYQRQLVRLVATQGYSKASFDAHRSLLRLAALASSLGYAALADRSSTRAAFAPPAVLS